MKPIDMLNFLLFIFPVYFCSFSINSCINSFFRLNFNSNFLHDIHFSIILRISTGSYIHVFLHLRSLLLCISYIIKIIKFIFSNK
ncbi:hypothetical protein CW304_32770 [Bacillus sp. UFRGS-B20]|nr:hypothetical protein CW304_32770 [Bacillus sp. UFRGS-B20]